MVPESQWKWYGSPLHFICASRCKFHLGTQVGKYIVSTVGEFYPTASSTVIEDIGYQRTFETMVFKRAGTCIGGCCPKIQPSELEMIPSNDRKAANKNHRMMCKKYAAKEA